MTADPVEFEVVRNGEFPNHKYSVEVAKTFMMFEEAQSFAASLAKRLGEVESLDRQLADSNTNRETLRHWNEKQREEIAAIIAEMATRISTRDNIILEQNRQAAELRGALAAIIEKAGAEMDYGSKNDTIRFCYVKAVDALAPQPG